MLYNYRGAFPYARFTLNGPILITGQVVTFDPMSTIYQQMDAVEVGAGYTERLIAVTLDSGHVVPAFAYEGGPWVVDSLEPHPTGDWKNIRKT